ncbi:DUF6890 family protein [Vibrio amylolyticus]|uniref:DUF6890 family protein n=1 Tax=Vibrio amylolyticus TaxID=2847292 RepID=UPI0035591569
MDENGIEQAFTLRQHYFPNGEDDEQTLARAMWLDKRELKRTEVAVQNAIANLFNKK